MPLTPNFSSSQTTGEPSIAVLTDTSTGSNVSIVSRRVYLVNSEGDYVVPTGTSTDYVVWPIVSGTGDTIDIDVLTEDAALDITVNWVDISGVTVETKTTLCGFTLYNESFYYSLTQAQASQSQPPPMIIQDTNYYSNKMILRVQIDSGNNAITLGNDITTAQNCYDLATYMVTNQDYYF